MKKTLIALATSLLFAQSSLAHAPFLECSVSDESISCVGSFSDGSSAFGVKITVLDYSDEVLFEGDLDKDSKIIFSKPDEEEYYIKFDAGPGHVFEVDHTDIATQKNSKKDDNQDKSKEKS